MVIIITLGQSNAYCRLIAGEEVSVQMNGLGSAWGAVVPLLAVPLLATLEISFDVWRILITLGLLATAGMLYHPKLRDYLLLPSCMALGAGLLSVTLHAVSR